MNVTEIRPVIDPILNLLRSRKVLTALVALGMAILIALVPDLQPVRGELYTFVLALAIALIGGTTIEDAARHVSANPDPQKSPRDAARALGEVVLEEVFDAIEEKPRG